MAELRRQDLPLSEPETEAQSDDPADRWARRRALAGVASLAGIVLVAMGLVFVRSRPAPVVIESGPLDRPSGPTAPAAVTPTVVATVTVHVAGAVRAPGVVVLRGSPRVIDALRAAGGPTDDAAPDLLNLAKPVRDGERVAVPRQGDPPPPSVIDPSSAPDGSAGAGPVDINGASADQLDRLPGIGPVLAQRIVDHRRVHGPFHDVGQLRDVPGIGEKVLSGLSGLVVVGAA